jgi:hypothetical protein
MFFCCKCCMLSGRGLCDEMITRPEESYRLWCVVVCDLETSRMRKPWPALGRSATEKIYHASRNEVRRLTCICLTAAHIHGTILLFYLFTFYFLHNPTLHVTSYHVKMWRSGKMLLKFQILNANYCCT